MKYFFKVKSRQETDTGRRGNRKEREKRKRERKVQCNTHNGAMAREVILAVPIKVFFANSLPMAKL